MVAMVAYRGTPREESAGREARKRKNLCFSLRTRYWIQFDDSNQSDRGEGGYFNLGEVEGEIKLPPGE